MVMFRQIIAAFILVPWITVSAAANSFQTGLDAYNRGDHRQAMAQWLPLAEGGNAAAQFNIGLMHETGQGVAQDHAAAAIWYRKAADNGSPDAQNNLAFLYSLGRGVPKDMAKAAAWYRKAADQGYVGAQFSLGSLYLKGIGVPQDDAWAIQWYLKAAARGYAPAQNNLGAMYFSGQGVHRNHAEAVKWYRKAARQGHADARRSLDLLAGAKSNARIGMPQPLYAMQAEREEKSSGPSRPGFRVQLAAVKSDEPATANEMARRLNRDHGPVLDPLTVVPMRADLGERGVYYRLRAGPFAEYAAAAEICRKLQARHQSCIVLRSKDSN
jgi:TPR repeat protein